MRSCAFRPRNGIHRLWKTFLPLANLTIYVFSHRSTHQVMGMLEQIIAETKTMEADAVKAETDAQKAYESFVKDANASMEEKVRDITNKSEEKATAEADKVSIFI